MPILTAKQTWKRAPTSRKSRAELNRGRAGRCLLRRTSGSPGFQQQTWPPETPRRRSAREAMRAIFEVLNWGDWVDDGDSAPRYCTLGGVAKINGPDRPYLAINEYVCAELGRVVGLPTVPGVVVNDGALQGFVSLRFGPKGEQPPPAIPSEFAQAEPDLAAGVVAFDCWIANPDRHSGNFAYSRSTSATHLFDHDMALLGRRGASKLGELSGAHLLQRHPVARELRDPVPLLDWANVISHVSSRSIGLALGELRSAGLLTPEDAKIVADFLEQRSRGISAMLRQARDDRAFPNAPNFLI